MNFFAKSKMVETFDQGLIFFLLTQKISVQNMGIKIGVKINHIFLYSEIKTGYQKHPCNLPYKSFIDPTSFLEQI